MGGTPGQPAHPGATMTVGRLLQTLIQPGHPRLRWVGRLHRQAATSTVDGVPAETVVHDAQLFPWN
jgi:hypothetical protein